MHNKFGLKSFVICSAASALLAAGIAAAAPITVDFETAPGTNYDLFFGATQVTTQAHSPTHSANLSIPASPATDQELVRITPSGFVLGQTAGSFWAFIPGGGNLAPYMEFGVDVNANGIWEPSTSDALVIAFISGVGSFPVDTWFQTGLDALTNVHVVGNRPGLAAGTFSSSGTQDTLAHLSAISIPIADGGGTWGDRPLLRTYVTVGEWPGVTQYSSFVDDISLSQVPEPATLALLGLGLAGLGLSRRKR